MRHVRDEGSKSVSIPGSHQMAGRRRERRRAVDGKADAAGVRALREHLQRTPLRRRGLADEPHALRLSQSWGSITARMAAVCNRIAGVERGIDPLSPVPTTLPTLDELIGTDGATPDNVAEQLRRRRRPPSAKVRVYSPCRTRGACSPVLEALIPGWKGRLDHVDAQALRDRAAARHCLAMRLPRTVRGEAAPCSCRVGNFSAT